MNDAQQALEAVSALVRDNMGRIQETRYEVSWKEDGSPVTESDILVERLIHDTLTEQLGDLVFIGEETFDSYDGQLPGWTAVLDPIDGTENFCSGFKEWGVSLSLWRDGAHQASLLLLPELGERLMTGDRIAYQRSRITGFSSSLPPATLRELSDLGEVRIMGCAVYNLFNVIRGAYARFINPLGAKTWDLLAGVNLALEHGCDVDVDGTPYDGRFLEPGRKYRVDVRHRHDPDPR